MARGKTQVKEQNVVFVDVEDMVKLLKHIDYCPEWYEIEASQLYDKILKANPWLKNKL